MAHETPENLPHRRNLIRFQSEIVGVLLPRKLGLDGVVHFSGSQNACFQETMLVHVQVAAILVLTEAGDTDSLVPEDFLRNVRNVLPHLLL